MSFSKQGALALFASATLATVAQTTQATPVYVVGRVDSRLLASDGTGLNYATFAALPYQGRGVANGGGSVYGFNGSFTPGLGDPSPAVPATITRFDTSGNLVASTSAGGTDTGGNVVNLGGSGALDVVTGTGATDGLWYVGNDRVYRYNSNFSNGANAAFVQSTFWSGEDHEFVRDPNGNLSLFIAGGGAGRIRRMTWNSGTSQFDNFYTNGSANQLRSAGNYDLNTMTLAQAPNGDIILSSYANSTDPLNDAGGLYLFNDPFGSYQDAASVTKLLDFANNTAPTSTDPGSGNTVSFGNEITDIEFDLSSDTGSSAVMYLANRANWIYKYQYTYSTKTFNLLGSTQYAGYPGTGAADFGESQPRQISIQAGAIAVPEPSSLALLGVGALALRRRR